MMEELDFNTLLSRTIENTLFHRYDFSDHAYLLLEMRTEHPLSDLLRACPPARMRYLAHRDFESCPTQAPLLIRLEPRHDPLLAASVELAVMQATDLEVPSRQISGWLFSDLPLEEMTDQLSQRLTAVHDHGLVRLRLQDPRVLVQLPHMLDRQQSQQLFSIGHWYCVNDGGELQYMDQSQSQSESESEPEPEPESRYSMLITQSQLGGIKRICIAISAIEILRTMGLRYDREWIALMHAQILNAIAYGFTDATDLATYAAHGVVVHPCFDQHPQIAEAISKSRLHGYSFIKAIYEFDGAALEVIAKEMAREHGEEEQGATQ